MTDSRKVIRAFLASPGDLQEERKAVRDVVVEFNEVWADRLGYQVELVGWEETVAGYGRPQQLINQDLDRCDLFLGMIWKRWGTPPDTGGEFSSGFHEEFERSIRRRERTGKPEICLFFKEIGTEFLADPGPDLERVLEFRSGIVSAKSLLFQNFPDVRSMETLARKSISSYVNRIKTEQEGIEAEDVETKRTSFQTSKRAAYSRGAGSSTFMAEGLEFLETLLTRIKETESTDALSPFEVARFRLLSNLMTRPGNQEIRLQHSPNRS